MVSRGLANSRYQLTCNLVQEFTCVISDKANTIELGYNMDAAVIIVSDDVRLVSSYKVQHTHFDAAPFKPTR